MSNLGEVSQKYSTCLKTKSQCKKDCKKWSRKNTIINAHSKYGKDTIININPHNIRYTHIYTSTSQYISLSMVLKPQAMWLSQHEIKEIPLISKMVTPFSEKLPVHT